MFIKYSTSSLGIYRSILFISLDYNGIKNMGHTENFQKNPSALGLDFLNFFKFKFRKFVCPFFILHFSLCNISGSSV